MKKIFITGIAGVLGSSMARNLIDHGYKVSGNDKVRIEEAWKLEGYKEKIKYLWKSSIDIDPKDIDGSDVLIDCALESADRPFGLNSPVQTWIGNLLPSLMVLEAVRKCKKQPISIYPSSFNVFYGHNPGTILNESCPSMTSSIYGLTKQTVENLYLAYNKAWNIPTIVTRVGSAFGPTMRSDELIGRLIIYCLKGKDFYLRSPETKRLWCYAEDVIDFYNKLLKNPHRFIGRILHCAGNKNHEIITNIELAERIKKLTKSNIQIILGSYEAGETVNGKPIDFQVDSLYTESVLNWHPNHSLNDGLIKTIKWFKENLRRYSVK